MRVTRIVDGSQMLTTPEAPRNKGSAGWAEGRLAQGGILPIAQ